MPPTTHPAASPARLRPGDWGARATVHVVQTREPGTDHWSEEACGDFTRYPTEAAAQEAIDSLRVLGGEWAEAEYRIDEQEADGTERWGEPPYADAITIPEGWTVHGPVDGRVEIVVPPASTDEHGVDHYTPGVGREAGELAAALLGGPVRFRDVGEAGGEVWVLADAIADPTPGPHPWDDDVWLRAGRDDATGRVTSSWVSACRSNALGSDVTVEDWICLALDAQRAWIDSDGRVLVQAAGGSSWLDQDRVDEMVRRIEEGV